MNNFERFPSWLAGLLAAGLLSGCSGAMSDVVVPVSLDTPPSVAQDQALPASVEVVDLRLDSTMRRTAFAASLGKVTLSPPEGELVKALVAKALQRIDGDLSLLGVPPTIYCGIKTFDIITPATPLYWDVTTRIELILRARKKERTVSAEAVEQTWTYPSEEIIQRVTMRALHDISSAIEQELPALLAPTP